jgi:hypothetical protein
MTSDTFITIMLSVILPNVVMLNVGDPFWEQTMTLLTVMINPVVS